MKAHPDTTPTVEEDTVSGLEVGDTLAIRNEEDDTEMTLVTQVVRLNSYVTQVTVLRSDLTYQTGNFSKFELVRTGA